MIEPTERQKFLLALVVHEYARTAAPVGSRYLVEHYNLDMSSATVRNELAALTEMGYLRQPHTSAGRVPTEEGYRYFVGRLLQETELPDTVRRTITHQFYQMRNDVDQWMRLAASVLAHQSRGGLAGDRAPPRKSPPQAPRADLHPRAAGADGAGDGRRRNPPAPDDPRRAGAPGAAFAGRRPHHAPVPGQGCRGHPHGAQQLQRPGAGRAGVGGRRPGPGRRRTSPARSTWTG